jgi:hypothetical protein
MKKIWALLLLLLILPACAPESVSRYQTGENSEEIVSLLNERDYDKAIWLIENHEGKNPEGENAYLLAEAYLGKAGIEPLAFASRVAGPEPESPAAEALFPECPKEAIRSIHQVEMKCLLKRVYLQAQGANAIYLARAQRLFRKAYPNPALSPDWVNTLIGTVEMISLVKRAGDLFFYAKRGHFSPSDLPWIQSQGRSAYAEAKEALGRANHSGEKISRLLSGAKANEWFERVEGTIQFAKEVGLSRFLDFVRENLLKPSDEIRYGDTLDQLKATLDALEKGKDRASLETGLESNP